MIQVNWLQVAIDIIQAVISGVFVGVVIYWLDERRAKRERRLSDFRIASNWSITEPKVSLRNFDLRKANLSGYEFVKANLESAIISDTYLWSTDFSEANLRYADFRRSTIVTVKFVGANMRRVDFSKSVIRRSKAHKTPSDFTDADLQKCVFAGAQLEGVILVKTNLGFADFGNAFVLDCDFTGADLSGSMWRKVKKAENCIWKDVKIDSQSEFPEYLLKEIREQNAKPIKKKRNTK